MAEYLASIFGTEKDKVNCSFYYKIGACRHGDRCSRQHIKPTFSQTILITNLYISPGNTMSPEDVQKHYDDFYCDIFWELEEKYGAIEEMVVCDNLGEHLVGNVYVKFEREEDAQRAVDGLNNRYYAGRPLYAELSPVTDFREACCRQYDMNQCNRGGYCNFMHLKPLSRDLKAVFAPRRRDRSPPRSRGRRDDRRDDRRSRRDEPEDDEYTAPDANEYTSGSAW